MKVAIIGGGNVGTAIAAEIAVRHEVFLQCSKPDGWSKTITSIDRTRNITFQSSLTQITDDFEEVVCGADVVLVTHPSFMLENTFAKILPYLKSGSIIGAVPGTGGIEFYGKDIIAEGHILFGLDRVPCIARINENGKSVFSDKKQSIRVAAICAKDTPQVCSVLSSLLDINCIALKNYLTVTLTPSNPLLHTVRLYTMLKSYPENCSFDYNIPFYGEWDMESSVMLLKCDEELHMLCNLISSEELDGVVPLKIHYESENALELTAKIRSITSLKTISSPMKLFNGQYVPDFSSRYFIEDIPYGLCIIKGLALIFGLQTPQIDLILRWYESISSKQYFTECNMGKDILSCAAPQKYGYNSPMQICNLYGLR